VESLERVRQALRALGTVAGLSSAAALANRSLRERVPLPLDQIGGVRRTWRWRDYEIFVTELGAGPPLLLVHGIYVGASSFEYRMLAALLARHHRVVLLDLLGCGLSEMPKLDYSTELFVEQIVDALGEFFDGPMTLVGSSLGAAFAIRAALRAPDRVTRLVVVCPTGLGGVLDRDATLLQHAAGACLRSPVLGESLFNWLASKRSLRRVLRSQAYADPAHATPDVVDHYYAIAHQPGARNVPAAFVGGALNSDVVRDLPFVEAPVLVLWGGETTRINPRANAAQFERLARDARSETIANARLLPHDEAAGDVARAIEAFISSGGDDGA